MFKPMLSGKADLDKLDWSAGIAASGKCDGVRMLVIDGVAMSRSLKPIPNKHVQKLFGRPELNGLDGEIVCGEVTAPDVYIKTNSAVMSVEGEPCVTYWIFDYWAAPNAPFTERIELARATAELSPHTRILPQTLIAARSELDTFREQALAQGFEGVMLRRLDAPYKHGRSSTKEGYLLKLKDFEDAEGQIIGVLEEQANLNEATTDELGHTKRSSHKENKVGKGTMGALRVKVLNGPFTGCEVKIGTGFTAEQRAQPWRMGDVVTFKYMPHGSKDAPRHPVFLRRRSIDEVELGR